MRHFNHGSLRRPYQEMCPWIGSKTVSSFCTDMMQGRRCLQGSSGGVLSRPLAVFWSAQGCAKAAVCYLCVLSLFSHISSTITFDKSGLCLMFRIVNISSINAPTPASETKHHNFWSSAQHCSVNRCFLFLSIKYFFELHRLWGKCAWCICTCMCILNNSQWEMFSENKTIFISENLCTHKVDSWLSLNPLLLT